MLDNKELTQNFIQKVYDLINSYPTYELIIDDIGHVFYCELKSGETKLYFLHHDYNILCDFYNQKAKYIENGFALQYDFNSNKLINFDHNQACNCNSIKPLAIENIPSNWVENASFEHFSPNFVSILGNV